MMRALVVTVCWGWVVFAQDAAPKFEVATVKAHPPEPNGRLIPRVTGGPGSSDPRRWSCTGCSFLSLLTYAYNLKMYQVAGPDWMRVDPFDVVATFPEGTSRENWRLMLQALLAERFQMATHREDRQTPIYELVEAKGGHKLQPWIDGPPGSVVGPAGVQLDKDGFPIIAGGTGQLSVAGRTRLQFKKQTLEGIAYLLGGHVDRPVIDATGLKGWYAFTLSFNTPLPSAPNADDAGLSVFAAVTQQLGLRLVPTKGPVNYLVIDRVERRPTEN